MDSRGEDGWSKQRLQWGLKAVWDDSLGCLPMHTHASTPLGPQCFSIELTRNYGLTEFRESLKDLFK